MGNEDVAAIAEAVASVVEEVSTEIYGHQRIVKLITGALLIGGHVLLEGPPGIAKTTMAKSLAVAMGLSFSRIQFTPDLMPSDVTGVYVFDQKSGTFRFAAGPVFAEILLADEINRTPPKTQSALLEAMEEHNVTIDGNRHPLGDFFFVIATQNPVEHEGTYPLPEAQLDRFLFKLKMSYPPKEQEQSMIQRLSGMQPLFGELSSSLRPALKREQILQARAAVRNIGLSPTITDYIMRVVVMTRSFGGVLLGASPRAGLNLALASKFSAASEGRAYVTPDDVKAMAVDVLAHRLVFEPESFEKAAKPEETIREILGRVPVPSQILQ